MSLLDDENILIEQTKLSIKDSVKSLLQLDHLNELVEYLDNVMHIKDYQWELVKSLYGGNVVALVNGSFMICQLKLTLDTKKPILFFNPLLKYRCSKIEILNKLDIVCDSDYEFDSAYFML